MTANKFKLRARPANRESGRVTRHRQTVHFGLEFWKRFKAWVHIGKGSDGSASRTLECAGWLWLYAYTGAQSDLDQYRTMLEKLIEDPRQRQQMDERLRRAALGEDSK